MNRSVRVFGLRADEVAKRAEHWIVDVLALSDDEVLAESAEKDSRYRWERIQNDHGSHAQVEDLRSYAQYHGLQLAAGALIDAGTPVRVSPYDEGFDPWSNWLEDHLPIWGRAGCQNSEVLPQLKPLLIDRSRRSHRRNRARLILTHSSGWIRPRRGLFVDAHEHRSDTKQYESGSVTSALVSPATAHALMVALQTTKDSSDFRLPPENREPDDDTGHFEIDDGEFVLRGWLKEHYSECLGLEKHDAIRRIAPHNTSVGHKFLLSSAATSEIGHRDIYGVDGRCISDVFAWSDEPRRQPL